MYCFFSILSSTKEFKKYMKISSTSERLKTLMKEKNYRQIDILNKCKPYCQQYNVKLGRNDLSQYVSGKVEPGQEKLSILSMALNVNEAWLMGYDVPKRRGQPIVSSHQSFDDDVLYAIDTLAQKSGYHFDIFAKQYQISTNDYIIKLSPKEVNDYVNSSIMQIRFITECIIKNKLNDNITSIREDSIPIAAHKRTDAEQTVEGDQHDDDVMNDDSEWE